MELCWFISLIFFCFLLVNISFYYYCYHQYYHYSNYHDCYHFVISHFPVPFPLTFLHFSSTFLFFSSLISSSSFPLFPWTHPSSAHASSHPLFATTHPSSPSPPPLFKLPPLVFTFALRFSSVHNEQQTGFKGGTTNDVSLGRNKQGMKGRANAEWKR